MAILWLCELMLCKALGLMSESLGLGSPCVTSLLISLPILCWRKHGYFRGASELSVNISKADFPELDCRFRGKNSQVIDCNICVLGQYSNLRK